MHDVHDSKKIPACSKSLDSNISVLLWNMEATDALFFQVCNYDVEQVIETGSCHQRMNHKGSFCRCGKKCLSTSLRSSGTLSPSIPVCLKMLYSDAAWDIETNTSLSNRKELHEQERLYLEPKGHSVCHLIQSAHSFIGQNRLICLSSHLSINNGMT